MNTAVLEHPPCTVPPAQPEDIPVLCLLKWQFAVGEEATFVVRASPADWMRDMLGPEPRLSALVAEAHGAVIGMAIITTRYCAGWVGPLFAIDDLFVVPAHRGHGVGKALLTGAVRQAFERGATFIELTVREDNHAAIRLYRQVGFERVPGITLVLGGDAFAALACHRPAEEVADAEPGIIAAGGHGLG